MVLYEYVKSDNTVARGMDDRDRYSRGGGYNKLILAQVLIRFYLSLHLFLYSSPNSRSLALILSLSLSLSPCLLVRSPHFVVTFWRRHSWRIE